jgi:hypothetical protein
MAGMVLATKMPVANRVITLVRVLISKPVIGGHIRQNPGATTHHQQVLIDQKDHQHDVELVRKLGKNLTQPKLAKIAQGHHGLDPALAFRVAAGGQGGFWGGQAWAAQGVNASRP